MQEAEPWRVAFFEMDGQVFQRVIDYPDVELAFHDLSRSRAKSRQGSPREATEVMESKLNMRVINHLLETGHPSGKRQP